MGMFMSSVAFRCTDVAGRKEAIEDIKALCIGADQLVDNLNSEGPGYAILSPYGDMGAFLAKLPQRISLIIKGYVVFATCVDSDYIMIELYHNGNLLEKSCIGEVYEEFSEFMEINRPDVELWAHLLLDPSQKGALELALLGDEIFAEDHLRKLSLLTGIPILDDEMLADV